MAAAQSNSCLGFTIGDLFPASRDRMLFRRRSHGGPAAGRAGGGGGEWCSLAALMLADDIAAAHSKERVLEWFLNSADYGNLAFGIDAAARVYLGKPAEGLPVGEASLLAAL